MDLVKWLLEGDVSIQYQVYRDLLNKDKPALRKRIIKEGFGKKLLSNQQDSPFGEDAPAPQNASFDGLVNANLSPLHDSFTPPAPQQTQQSSATDDAAMPDDFNFEDLFDNHSNEVTSIPDIQSQNSPAR